MNNKKIDNNSNTEVYTFILSLVDISINLPVEIIPGHFLKKAEHHQIGRFREFLNNSSFFDRPSDYYVYENNLIQEKSDGDSISFVSELLPKEKWKYWVISHKGYSPEMKHLAKAALLLKDGIEFGPEFHGTTGMSIDNYQAIISHLTTPESAHHVTSTSELSHEDFTNIQKYYLLIKNLDTKYTNIKNALSLFDDLRSLPRSSDFVVLGLFSIIESLISHSPKLDFFHDSIKHQMKSKILLLEKRFTRNLNYSYYFGSNAKAEKVISNLYDYRSGIVHSGITIMPIELSKVLISNEAAKEFLYELTKLILLAALSEPELITDLKAC